MALAEQIAPLLAAADPLSAKAAQKLARSHSEALLAAARGKDLDAGPLAIAQLYRLRTALSCGPLGLERLHGQLCVRLVEAGRAEAAAAEVLGLCAQLAAPCSSDADAWDAALALGAPADEHEAEVAVLAGLAAGRLAVDAGRADAADRVLAATLAALEQCAPPRSLAKYVVRLAWRAPEGTAPLAAFKRRCSALPALADDRPLLLEQLHRAGAGLARADPAAVLSAYEALGGGGGGGGGPWTGDKRELQWLDHVVTVATAARDWTFALSALASFPHQDDAVLLLIRSAAHTSAGDAEQGRAFLKQALAMDLGDTDPERLAPQVDRARKLALHFGEFDGLAQLEPAARARSAASHKALLCALTSGGAADAADLAAAGVDARDAAVARFNGAVRRHQAGDTEAALPAMLEACRALGDDGKKYEMTAAAALAVQRFDAAAEALAAAAALQDKPALLPRMVAVALRAGTLEAAAATPGLPEAALAAALELHMPRGDAAAACLAAYASALGDAWAARGRRLAVALGCEWPGSASASASVGRELEYATGVVAEDGEGDVFYRCWRSLRLGGSAIDDVAREESCMAPLGDVAPAAREAVEAARLLAEGESPAAADRAQAAAAAALQLLPAKTSSSTTNTDEGQLTAAQQEEAAEKDRRRPVLSVPFAGLDAAWPAIVVAAHALATLSEAWVRCGCARKARYYARQVQQLGAAADSAPLEARGRTLLARVAAARADWAEVEGLACADAGVQGALLLARGDAEGAARRFEEAGDAVALARVRGDAPPSADSLADAADRVEALRLAGELEAALEACRGGRVSAALYRRVGREAAAQRLAAGDEAGAAEALCATVGAAFRVAGAEEIDIDWAALPCAVLVLAVLPDGGGLLAARATPQQGPAGAWLVPDFDAAGMQAELDGILAANRESMAGHTAAEARAWTAERKTQWWALREVLDARMAALVTAMGDALPFLQPPRTVADLRAALSGEGLPTGGKKAELAARLQAAPLLLVPDEQLQAWPWESMPVLRERPVSRMPSVAGAVRAAVEVDLGRAASVVDPFGDLLSTRATFRTLLGELRDAHGWQGDVELSGQAPSADDVRAALTEHDLYLYCGHGAGEAFLGRDAVARLERCAAALLVGCSSARQRREGDFEPGGMVAAYLTAGCPALVGNLWDVSDRDIDRFAGALLREFVGGAPLSAAVPAARKACKMGYLVGAAPVHFGVPGVSRG